jgi:hypothetical protein
VQRVFLHVGAPKTGTTFLQKRLLRLHDRLRDEQHVLFPTDAYDRHYFAAVDLQDGMFHGSYIAESRGQWSQVAAAARAWPGTSIISHEVLASAAPEHVRRAVADLAPAEVHVVYTARDLGRQLTSRWQEDVKHGLSDTFDQWWAAVARHDEHHGHARWFWHTDDPTDVLARWGGVVGPDRFHLVTVPRGTGPDELWRRFAGVVGFDPALADDDVPDEENAGLGVAEAELVRRVNGALLGVYAATDYNHAVKGVLAHETLRRHTGDRRITLPPDLYPAVRALAEEWTAALADSGVHVVGDLAELLPSPPPEGGEPGSAAADEVLDAAVWTISELLQEIHRHRAELRVLHRLLGVLPVRTAVRARLSAGRALKAVDERFDLGLWRVLRRGSPPA